jgi:hypothetical protein
MIWTAQKIKKKLGDGHVHRQEGDLISPLTRIRVGYTDRQTGRWSHKVKSKAFFCLFRIRLLD